MFLPRDPVGAPGSYPTEMFTVMKPRRQPKRAARVLRGQGNGLESAHQYSLGQGATARKLPGFWAFRGSSSRPGKGPCGPGTGVHSGA